MEVCFADDDLERLETDDAFTAGLPQAIVKAFRKRMQHIRAAADERDLRSWASLRFEKLSGKRRGQHSLRLNDQYRLIVELESSANKKTVRIVEIEDYH
jgi:toxin HigB-1